MHLEDCREFLMNTARRLLAADSPSGFTQQAAAVVEQIAEELGYPVRRTNKGNVILSVRGRERGKTVGLCAHIDTLGLMVRSITADGMLMITKIGGPILPTLDGEYCRIYTRDGRMYTGTILSLSPAAHVFDDVLTRSPGRKEFGGAHRRTSAGQGRRGGAGHLRRGFCVLRPQNPGHRQRLFKVPLHRR